MDPLGDLRVISTLSSIHFTQIQVSPTLPRPCTTRANQTFTATLQAQVYPLRVQGDMVLDATLKMALQCTLTRRMSAIQQTSKA